MSWYHEQCVGVAKDEPVGVWLCLSCRKVPQGLQSSITALTSDIEQLKVSTSSILVALGHLTTQVSTSISGIHDKLAALSNQVRCNDKKMSETLDSLNMASDSMKTNFDQKTCQILNKTSTIIDKIKQNSEKVNPVTKTISESVTATNASNSANTDKYNPLKQTKKPLNQNQKPTEKAKQADKPKDTISVSQSPTEHPMRPMEEIETVDLTKSPKSKRPIFQSTLLVGSSILKSVKVNELKKNTAVRSFPGATIEGLERKLNNYNIDKCKTIVIHVGGNDADQGVDIETFTESFSSLLDNMASENRRLIVSGLLPRESVNLDPYNKSLKTLCATKDVEFIDHYNGFLLASGDMADSYFHKDKLHLNSFGTRKLLKNIDAMYKVTNAHTHS